MGHVIRKFYTTLLAMVMVSIGTLALAQEQKAPEAIPTSQVQSTIRVLTEELRTILNADTVVGKPIELKGFTIIPLLSTGFGLGTGQGDMRMKNLMMDMMGKMGGEAAKRDHGAGEGSSAGAGAGSGGSIQVGAILVVSDKGVEVLPVHKGVLADVAEALAPIILEGIKSRRTGTTAPPATQ
ncbi:MAG TPA: hypothetical protein ENI07_00585 [Desulfobacterales bacterium]|nr:hypothetical protein [Desulfobacterales bacterium]